MPSGSRTIGPAHPRIWSTASSCGGDAARPGKVVETLVAVMLVGEDSDPAEPERWSREPPRQREELASTGGAVTMPKYASTSASAASSWSWNTFSPAMIRTSNHSM